MLESSKSKARKSRSSSGSPSKRPKASRFLEMAIAAVAFVVLLYVISVSVRVATGVSKTVETPKHVVRLQILNGCGVDGLAARMGDIMSGFSDRDLDIRVVDADNFDIRTVTRSFVISREEDESGATMLARKIGLDPAEVVYRPLENNYRQVSATLVLGMDWETIKLPHEFGKQK